MPKQNTEETLNQSKLTLLEIETAYNRSLHDKRIHAGLRANIKIFCESASRALEQCAMDIHAKYCPPAKSVRFPVARNPGEFSKVASREFPGLEKRSPKLWECLRSMQPFNPGYEWIGSFEHLHKENAHKRLVEKTMTETLHAKIIFGRKSFNWQHQGLKPNSAGAATVISILMGMALPRYAQTFERLLWIDFKFEGIDESAIGLLKKICAGVEKITAEVYGRLEG